MKSKCLKHIWVIGWGEKKGKTFKVSRDGFFCKRCNVKKIIEYCPHGECLYKFINGEVVDYIPCDKCIKISGEVVDNQANPQQDVREIG